MRYEFSLDTLNFTLVEAEVAAQFRRAARTVEIEQRFFPASANVNMRWAMVAGVDHDSVAADSQNGRH